MVAHYDAHRTDPEVMWWTAVAQQHGFLKVDRSTIDLIRAAADTGHRGALSGLGTAYLVGESVPIDRKRGVKLLEEALAKGESAAAYELGRAYLMGAAGLTVDVNLAEKYLKQSLEMGNIRAHFLLATVHEKRGDKKASFEELRKSADAGDEAGMETLGSVYQLGKLNVPPDPKQAIQWTQRAAERGRKSAQRELAKMIINGYGGIDRTAKNEAVALRCLKGASDAGDIEAMRLLARTYISGELGVEIQPDKGVELLRKAEEMRDPMAAAAAFELGVLYIEGLALPRDLEAARAQMAKASLMGSRAADSYLRRLDAATAASQPSTRPSTRAF
jgi:TPR repeat protein